MSTNHIFELLDKDAEDLLKHPCKSIPPSPDFVSKSFGSSNDEKMYSAFSTNHPIGLTRYMAANWYVSKIGLINLDKIAQGHIDIAGVLMTAVIRPFSEGIKLLNYVQEVYLEKDITLV